MEGSCKRQNIKKWYWITGAISVILQIMTMSVTYDIKIIADELCSIASAAHLAGLDWTNIVGTSKYYGFGYYFFNAIWFVLFEEPIYIYYAIKFSNIIVAAIASVIFYHIGVKYIGYKPGMECVCVASLTGFIGLFKGNRLYNEYGILLITSLIVLCLFKTSSTTGRRKIGYSILLAVLCAWQLTIHTRTLLFMCIVIFIIILAYFFMDVKLVGFRYFAGAMLIFYCVSQFIKDWVITAWWKEGEKVYSGFNESIPIQSPFGWIFTGDGLNVSKDILISNSVICSNFTYGLFAIAFFLSIGFCCRYVVKKKKYMTETYSKQNINAYIMLFMGVLTVVGMILGLIYLNGEGIILTFDGERELSVKFRAYFMYRYYAPYTPLVFMATYKLLDKANLKLGYLAIVCYVVLTKFFFKDILPDISQNNFINDIIYFKPLETRDENYILFFGLVTLCMFLLVRLKRKYIYIVCIYCMLIYKIISGMGEWQYSFSLCDAGAKFVNDIECSEITVYAESNYYTYQFVLPKDTVMAGRPQLLQDNEIFLTTDELDLEQNKLTYKYRIMLDDNEIVYFNDDTIYEKVQIGDIYMNN